jgi:hypothetical protein
MPSSASLTRSTGCPEKKNPVFTGLSCWID